MLDAEADRTGEIGDTMHAAAPHTLQAAGRNSAATLHIGQHVLLRVEGIEPLRRASRLSKDIDATRRQEEPGEPLGLQGAPRSPLGPRGRGLGP